jgi:hypothetical protein
MKALRKSAGLFVLLAELPKAADLKEHQKRVLIFI